MANATPSRLGLVQGGSDNTALFLKVFSGEVLAAFEKATVFKDRTQSRSISSGKSAQFPATWRTTAAYHTPGSEIVGDVIPMQEKVITIDGLLLASTFISNIDEAMNHYDVRGIYSKEAGLALAYQYDKNVAQVGVLAARSAATFTGGDGGSSLTNASYGSDAAVLASGLFAAAQALDEKSVPSEDRAAYFRPAQYYLLAQNTTVINQWYGGQGSISEGEILKIGGVEIVKTNHLPNSNITTGVSTYQGNFTNTVGLVMHKSAVGTVKLMDMATESQYDIRRQGTLIVAKYAAGHGVLRPEAAVELKTA